MKFWKSPINVYESIYPFYWILKISGLVSFSFKSTGNQKIVTTAFNVFYFVGVCFGHLTMLFLLTFRTYILATDSIMFHQGLKMALFFDVLVTIFIILFQLIRRKSMRRFLEILHDFDEMVCKSSPMNNLLFKNIFFF
jgi:hypothetical protein